MLEVKHLTTVYDEVVAVDDVSFKIEKGEIVGLLGESGSGKSTVGLSILRLISAPGHIVSGEIELNGEPLLKLPENEMIKVRGARISMIFQDPFTSLNPVLSIGDQIAEVIELHQGKSRKEALKDAVEMLNIVQIREPQKRINDHPHQFSGGMRQRVMIAMALSCRPEFLIADEPTTALDVTVQAEILKLLKDVQRQMGLGILYITHNFGVVSDICSRVMVMYKGKLIEEGAVKDIMNDPKESYTRGLIDCLKVLRS